MLLGILHTYVTEKNNAWMLIPFSFLLHLIVYDTSKKTFETHPTTKPYILHKYIMFNVEKNTDSTYLLLSPLTICVILIKAVVVFYPFFTLLCSGLTDSISVCKSVWMYNVHREKGWRWLTTLLYFTLLYCLLVVNILTRWIIWLWMDEQVMVNRNGMDYGMDSSEKSVMAGIGFLTIASLLLSSSIVNCAARGWQNSHGWTPIVFVFFSYLVLSLCIMYVMYMYHTLCQAKMKLHST